MRRAVALAFFVLLAAPPEGWAKPKGCFTTVEESAEGIVRYGVRLREGARACDGDPWNAGTAPLWDQIDKQFGTRFAQQTKIRHDAFVREFEGDAENKLEYWNGRIVFYYRNYPTSPVYCATIKKDMQTMQAKGWNSFVKSAALGRDEVQMDYKVCQ